MSIIKLPNSLTNCIADSQADVISWSADSGALLLRIEKEIGPEIGTIHMNGVASVNLQPRFEISGISVYDSPCPDYPNLSLEPDEIAIAFQDSEGRVHLVVGESLDYVIDK